MAQKGWSYVLFLLKNCPTRLFFFKQHSRVYASSSSPSEVLPAEYNGKVHECVSFLLQLKHFLTLLYLLDNGIDMAYVEGSWIDHPDTGFKSDTVTNFLNYVACSQHRHFKIWVSSLGRIC